MAHQTLTGAWAGSGFQGRLIAEVDDLPAITADTGSINVTVRYHFEFSANTYDTSNTFTTGGSWPSVSASANFATTTKVWNARVQTITVTPKFDAALTLTVDASLTGINNIGGGTVLRVSGSVSIPRKPYLPPWPPNSFSASKTGPSSASITWIPNHTGADGARPQSSTTIDRYDSSLGNWYNGIANINVPGASWTDGGLSNDRRYIWRARGWGPGGLSTYSSDTVSIYTTPLAPSGVVATKDAAGDITVTWNSPSTIADRWQVWHSANGVWDPSPMATLTTRSYKHVAPSPTVIHSYQVVAIAPDNGTESSPSVASNTVQLLTNPYAPLDLAPNGVTVDRAMASELTWRHNPADGTPQTAYEIQWRSSTDGGASWSTLTSMGAVASSASTAAIAANFWPAGLIEFQVRTKGAYATEPAWSPWSATARFTAANRPSVTITSPPAGQYVITSTTSTSWSFAGSTGATQSAFTATLSQGSTLLESITGTTATSADFTTVLTNDTTYSISVTVRDSRGLEQSTSASVTTKFVEPPAPGVVGVWSPDTGRVTLTISNASGPSSTPAGNAIWVLVNGSWVSIGNVGINTSFVDYTPQAGALVQYRVVTTSTAGAVSHADQTVATPNNGDWFWVNHGPGYAQVARARLSPRTSSTFSVERTQHHFARRTKAVSFFGEAEQLVVNVSCSIEQSDPLGNREAWMNAVRSRGNVWYRDPLGRRIFGTIADVNFPNESNDVSDLTFKVEEEDIG